MDRRQMLTLFGVALIAPFRPAAAAESLEVRVCDLFHVPPEMVGALDELTWASVRSRHAAAYMAIIEPWRKSAEAAITMDLARAAAAENPAAELTPGWRRGGGVVTGRGSSSADKFA